MDLTTLGLAKKYANEKIKQAVFDGAKVVLDDTLTEAGSAAEARAVGNKVKEIEAKIPKSVSELENDAGFITAKTQAQADWNQNDPDAPDYVKNRPFYEGYKILGTFMRGNTVSQISLTVGKSYIVDCDGVMYTVVCEQLSNGKGLRILKPDGPGVIFLFYETSQYVYEVDRVVLMEPVVHKLDEKFIPGTIARKTDILTEERVLQLIEENYPAAEEVAF